MNLETKGINGPPLELSFSLELRKQNDVLNGQHSFRSGAPAGVLQNIIFDSPKILTCINELSGGLTCNPKLFAGDASLFSILSNIIKATTYLCIDFIKITQWIFQWKMNFIPNITKQVCVVTKRTLELH